MTHLPSFLSTWLPQPQPGQALMRKAVVALGLLGSVAACGSGGGTGPSTTQTIADFECVNTASNGQVDCRALPEITNIVTAKKTYANSTDTLAVGSVNKGDRQSYDYEIKNIASFTTAAALQIASVRFDYTTVSPSETAEDKALVCQNSLGVDCGQLDGKWRKIVPVGSPVAAGLATSEKIRITFKRFDDKERSAKLLITFKGVDPANPTFQFTVKAKIGSPSASFQSALTEDPKGGMNFPYVAPGTCKEREVSLLNTGEAMLTVKGFDVGGLDPSFSLQLIKPPTLDAAKHVGGTPWVLPKDLEVAPGSTATLLVTFCPKDDKKKSGTVSIKKSSNDSNAQDLVLQANSAVPCIKTSVTTYNFGGTIPGTEPAKLTVDVCNCGPVELDVNSLDFVADETNSTEFSVDQDALYAAQKISNPPPVSSENPLKIGVGKCESVVVSYAPADLTPDENNPDRATIAFGSNAYVTPKLAVKGIGVDQTCPLAKVTVQEGEETVPQTLLHLVGSKSVAPGGGTIKKYKWTVKQPAGSNQPLLPNATFANPTLLANAAGEYTFCLDVWDQNDQQSCTPTCVTVLVIPNDAIHVELLWDTPADPDQTDTGPAAGADMDLHFGHPLAAELDLDCDGTADPWFANPWDTFWFNAQPEWGSPSAAVKDNPSLDLDDTDGAGPENLNLIQPEGELDDAVAYSVGVHYWNDHGYGTSYATVSIYIQGGLALQFTKVKMDPLDMWYVGKIWWPNTASGGTKKVFETCYQSGFSCTEKKNLMWQPKGDWCITKCYNNATFVGAVGGGAAASSCKQ
ncbi:MAG: hypothetical protein HY902_10640 [Deltaproteobacteria bacterium]|nr:hypothetical protein [Deltaproteobacteria bacterium]